MQYETLLSYLIGVLAVLFCGWLFSRRTRGLMRLALNSIVGAFLLTVLSLVTPLHLSLNPLNALLVGFLGLPGVALIAVITCLL